MKHSIWHENLLNFRRSFIDKAWWSMHESQRNQFSLINGDRTMETMKNRKQGIEFRRLGSLLVFSCVNFFCDHFLNGLIFCFGRKLGTSFWEFGEVHLSGYHQGPPGPGVQGSVLPWTRG